MCYKRLLFGNRNITVSDSELSTDLRLLRSKSLLMNVGNESALLSLTAPPQGPGEDVMTGRPPLFTSTKGTVSPIFKGCFKDPLEKNGTI